MNTIYTLPGAWEHHKVAQRNIQLPYIVTFNLLRMLAIQNIKVWNIIIRSFVDQYLSTVGDTFGCSFVSLGGTNMHCQ